MLCFGPRVILVNIFYAIQNSDRVCSGVSFDGIRHFCDRLRDSITDEKYISFQLSESDIADFCDSVIAYYQFPILSARCLIWAYGKRILIYSSHFIAV